MKCTQKGIIDWTIRLEIITPLQVVIPICNCAIIKFLIPNNDTDLANWERLTLWLVPLDRLYETRLLGVEKRTPRINLRHNG